MNHIELAKKAHKHGAKVALKTIKGAIEGLKEKLRHEEEVEKEMETITDEEYAIKYPEKIQVMKQQFGEN
jgi:hypothetical protein